MATKTALSRDGSWKVQVDVFNVNYFIYKALGVTTRAFQKTGPTWHNVKVDSIVAQGRLGSSAVPGASGLIPNSPNYRRNDSVADCRAWSVGIAITFVYDAPVGGFPPNPSPGGGPSMLADRVTGSGSATWHGETVSVGPLSA
jgi:hypothetical protein